MFVRNIFVPHNTDRNIFKHTLEFRTYSVQKVSQSITPFAGIFYAKTTMLKN